MEVTTTAWRKSTRSNGSTQCVEVRFTDNSVLIRDSKYQGDPAVQPTIAIPTGAWNQFLLIATGNTLNDSTAPGIPDITHDTTTGNTLLRDEAGTTLTYTPAEWEAFTTGIRDGEFNRGVLSGSELK